jgi:hypothetical protein
MASGGELRDDPATHGAGRARDDDHPCALRSFSSFMKYRLR